MSKSFDSDVDFISDCAQMIHDYLLDKGRLPVEWKKRSLDLSAIKRRVQSYADLLQSCYSSELTRVTDYTKEALNLIIEETFERHGIPNPIYHHREYGGGLSLSRILVSYIGERAPQEEDILRDYEPLPKEEYMTAYALLYSRDARDRFEKAFTACAPDWYDHDLDVKFGAVYCQPWDLEEDFVSQWDEGCSIKENARFFVERYYEAMEDVFTA